ncbi:Ras-related protein Rab-4B OS=Mus musculus GN=Rab4b PE=2 SV=2 [Rhizoctonia solani AG-1 IB]|uniref:Ras-related protein Rab-4B n=1 Tax=Thanatephorus cucumeris (strain AG1-IB / isolate 7/3/14) TaxID=1108050 RepID=A0A0B7FYQ5_THACB|nr:Ras-related protein Rab-4B OS=Mus musculus GN=Rab4b PE=2 SV=2 [Rhizoctonia solani AG-1 IB]
MTDVYDESVATEMVEAYDFLLKFIIIGEAGSGKSCLLHQFTQNSFKEHSQHTIGVEFSSRTINIGEKRVKLQLWDTAGQERFRSVTRSYYRGAAACLLVYDITSRSSFLNLSRWLADARALASSQLVAVLVGNKTDREEEREVEWSEASKWASENDVHFIETSSLTGDNIEKPFALAARAILLSIEGGQLDPEKAGSANVRESAVDRWAVGYPDIGLMLTLTPMLSYTEHHNYIHIFCPRSWYLSSSPVTRTV